MVDVMLPPSKIEDHALVVTKTVRIVWLSLRSLQQCPKRWNLLSILLRCTVQFLCRNPNDIDLFGVAQLCIFQRRLVIFT